MGNASSTQKFIKHSKRHVCHRTRSDESFTYVKGRRYLKDANKYILPNDNEELDRLHVLHDLHLQIWKSHFSSPIETILKSGGEVLDVGCGSGIWLLEMATNYPLSRFTGIDIVPLYPIDTHPWNVTFESADVSEGLPFPNDNFDLINLKGFLGTISEKHCNIKTLFNELLRVLKPGGWIEIMEYDNEVINPGPIMKFFCNSFQALLRQRGINIYLYNEIPKILNKYGFVDIRNEEKIINYGKKGGMIGDMSLKSFTSVISTLKCSLSEFTSINSKEFDNLLPSLIEEANVLCYSKPFTYWTIKNSSVTKTTINLLSTIDCKITVIEYKSPNDSMIFTFKGCLLLVHSAL